MKSNPTPAAPSKKTKKTQGAAPDLDQILSSAMTIPDPELVRDLGLESLLQLVGAQLGCPPERIKLVDQDALYDYCSDTLGLGSDYELPFVPTTKRGMTYETPDESGSYWVGTLGGRPAVQTKYFGLSTWYMESAAPTETA